MKRAKVEDLEIKSIRLPSRYWKLLDEDAERCRRSVAKQIEAILAVYFENAEVELHDVEDVRRIVSPTLQPSIKIPVYNVNEEGKTTDKRRKRA
jgi:hypothetical protein